VTGWFSAGVVPPGFEGFAGGACPVVSRLLGDLDISFDSGLAAPGVLHGTLKAIDHLFLL
jgi:hypothetical protein